MRPGRVLALWVAVVMGCNSVPAKHAKPTRDTIRYRLPLRGNSVSSSDAAHCFVGCQSAPGPKEYVDCLTACPGFESTPGEYCGKYEVPPESVCLTVRKIPAKAEVPVGLVVLAIVGEMALVVGAASLCQISNTQCGLYAVPPPK